MPWREATTMSQRIGFVRKAFKEDANVRALCCQYGVSPTTGYKWIRRFRMGGELALLDQSRRPHHSPRKNTRKNRDFGLGGTTRSPGLGRAKDQGISGKAGTY